MLSLSELRGKMVHSVDEVEAEIKHTVNIQDVLPPLPHGLNQLKQHPSHMEMSPFEKFVRSFCELLSQIILILEFENSSELKIMVASSNFAIINSYILV